MNRTANRLPILFVTAGLAVLLVWMAWPRALASLRYLPVEHALERYFRTLEIPTDRLPVLIRFAREALDSDDHHRFHEGLSVLHYLRALDIATPARERRGEYRAAESAAAESLARSPAQPATWLRIAYIRWVLRNEPAEVLEPWKMSIFTGRMAYGLILQRVEIGIAYRSELDDEGTAMLRDQLRLAWKMQPGSLMQLLRVRDPALQATRALLMATDPAALREMEAWLENVR